MADVLFTNVRIFDGGGETPFTGEVLVQGNRISRVTRTGHGARPLPVAGATVVDGAGAFLMPGMVEALTEAVIDKGRPFLGICVGMQLLSTRGLEKTTTRGLGWIPGDVREMEPVDPAREPGVGAVYRVRQPRLPVATWTITSWRPGEGFTWESPAPGVRSIGIHELATTEAGGTRIDLELRWHGPLRRVLELLYGRLGRRYVSTEAAALARRALGASSPA